MYPNFKIWTQSNPSLKLLKKLLRNENDNFFIKFFEGASILHQWNTSTVPTVAQIVPFLFDERVHERVIFGQSAALITGILHKINCIISDHIFKFNKYTQ